MFSQYLFNGPSPSGGLGQMGGGCRSFNIKGALTPQAPAIDAPSTTT